MRKILKGKLISIFIFKLYTNETKRIGHCEKWNPLFTQIQNIMDCTIHF